MDLVKSPLVPAHLQAKYEAEAGRYWDLFYLRNETRFFKDRHYFSHEFPQLLTSQVVLEVGCGVGNTVFPLLDLNPLVFVYACDFAPSAVALVQQHPQYAASGRVKAFVADITGDDLTANVPPGAVNLCTMIFVLSALSPEAMPGALRQVARTLRPGAQVLFRDYAVGDLAQDRLAADGRQQLLGDNFYVRWDGTRAFYFSQEGLRRLFEAEGFHFDSAKMVGKLVENRKKGDRMERRFLQAVFTYTGGGGSGSGDGSGSAGGGSSSGGGQQQAVPAPQAEHAVGQMEQGGTAGSQSSSGRSRSDGRRAGQLAAAAAAAAAAQQRLQQQQAEGELQQQMLHLGSTALHLCCRATPPPGSAAAAAAAASRAASEALAALVLRCPAFFHNARVVELCGWEAPLAALAALRWCHRAVAAGSSEAAMHLLRRNVRQNSHLFVIERLRLQQLCWQAQPRQDGGGSSSGGGGSLHQQQRQQQQQQEQEQVQQLLRAFPNGFHAVLAAVPASTCAAAAAADEARKELQRVLSVAAALLSQQAGSLVLLCATSQTEAERVLAAAAGAGLEQAQPPAEVAAAAAVAASGTAAVPAAQLPHFVCLQRRA